MCWLISVVMFVSGFIAKDMDMLVVSGLFAVADAINTYAKQQKG